MIKRLVSTAVVVSSLLMLGSSPPAVSQVTAVSPGAVPSSAHPPGGLPPSQVPQLVAITFDDNFNPEGMRWATELFRPLRNQAGGDLPADFDTTFDATPARTTFYATSAYATTMQASWLDALRDGHEFANHSHEHPDGLAFTQEQWTRQIAACNALLTETFASQVPGFGLQGFRAPFLHYNDRLFAALLDNRLVYDSSIMSCWADAENGTNCSWPYTLDGGSPDADAIYSKWRSRDVAPVGAHPGLLEIPVSLVFVPDDSLASRYGFAPGLRQRVRDVLAGAKNPNFYEPETGKLVAMDITMFMDAKMTKEEALATLKHTLDLRLAGNRAPFVFVGHTHVYAPEWNDYAPGVPDVTERRGVIEEFVEYALSRPEVRMRPMADVAAWARARSLAPSL